VEPLELGSIVQFGKPHNNFLSKVDYRGNYCREYLRQFTRLLRAANLTGIAIRHGAAAFVHDHFDVL
jgi:hypothetical protein